MSVTLKWAASLAVVLACGLAATHASTRAEQEFFSEPRPLFTVDPLIAPTVYQGGTVVLRVSVSPTGSVSDIEVLSSVPAITDPVVSAVRQWRFTPARLNEQPVGARTTIAVYVALQRNVAPGPG